MSDDNNPYAEDSPGVIGLQDMVNAYNFARSFINATKCDSALLKKNLNFKDGDYKRKVNRANVNTQVPLNNFDDFITNHLLTWKLGDEEYFQDLSETVNNWKNKLRLDRCSWF